MKTKIISVTKRTPCVICAATKNCKTGGGLVYCFYREGARKGEVEGGFAFLGKAKSEIWSLWKVDEGHKGNGNEILPMFTIEELAAMRSAEVATRKQEHTAKCHSSIEVHNFLYGQKPGINSIQSKGLIERGLSSEDIVINRYKEVGNGYYAGMSIPIWDIDGLMRGRQTHLDKRGTRDKGGREVPKYIWGEAIGEKHQKENLELPSQHCADFDVRPDGTRDYRLDKIERLIICEGALKPQVAYSRLFKGKNTMVIGYVGGNPCPETMRADIEKLPNLKSIEIAVDAGSGRNPHVVGNMYRTVEAIVAATSIKPTILNWGQWKEGCDIDEMDSLPGGCARESIDKYVAFRYSLGIDLVKFKQHFRPLWQGPDKEKVIRDLQQKKNWDKRVLEQDGTNWLEAYATEHKIVLMKVGTGHGKTHAIEELVKAGKRILYLCQSPDNPSTEFLCKHGERMPVKKPAMVERLSGELRGDGRKKWCQIDAEELLHDGIKPVEMEEATCKRYDQVKVIRETNSKVNPCKDCSYLKECIYQKQLAEFTERSLKLAASSNLEVEGRVVIAHHQSFQGRWPQQLEGCTFDMIVLDDIDPKFDSRSFSGDYMNRVVERLEAVGQVGVATALQFKLEKLGATWFGGRLDASVFEMLPAEILQLLADQEESDVLELEYAGKELEQPDDYWQPIPGSEHIDAASGKKRFKYTKDVIQNSLDYKEYAAAAAFNRSEAVQKAYGKGVLGKFFTTLLSHPNAVIYVQSRINPTVSEQGETTVVWLDCDLLNLLKSHAPKVAILDATTIVSETLRAWGYEQEDCIVYESTGRDNTGLSLKLMKDVDTLTKRSDQDVASQLCDLAVSRQAQGGRAAVVANVGWLGVKNVNKLKEVGAIALSAFGSSRGSNAAENCTDLIMGCSMRINIGAVDCEYALIYKEIPGESTLSHNYYSQRCLGELTQALGRLRHNRRTSEELTVWLPNLKDMKMLLFDEFPGASIEYAALCDEALTEKQAVCSGMLFEAERQAAQRLSREYQFNRFSRLDFPAIFEAAGVRYSKKFEEAFLFKFGGSQRSLLEHCFKLQTEGLTSNIDRLNVEVFVEEDYGKLLKINAIYLGADGRYRTTGRSYQPEHEPTVAEIDDTILRRQQHEAQRVILARASLAVLPHIMADSNGKLDDYYEIVYGDEPPDYHPGEIEFFDPPDV
jgi:hypothetical protein